MNITEQSRTVEIMVVEDNPGDVDLIRTALRRGKLSNRLIVATNGEDALAMLYEASTNSQGRLPDLIMLDLHLPGKSGIEVLAEIKEHPVFRRIPVVIMTSSDSEQDIFRTYDLHANFYVTKPVDLDQFREVVRSIADFWFTLVRLPTSEPTEAAAVDCLTTAVV